MTELSPGESTLRMSPEKALLLATNRICRTSSAAVIVPPALHSSTTSVLRAASKRLQEQTSTYGCWRVGKHHNTLKVTAPVR